MSIISSRAAHRRADVVVAGRQAVDAELPEVVRLGDTAGGRARAGGGRSANSAASRVTATSGIASPNSSTMRPAMTLPRGMLMSALSRRLLVGELDRLARLERPRLPVLHVDEPRLGRLQREAAGRKLAELEAPLARRSAPLSARRPVRRCAPARGGSGQRRRWPARGRECARARLELARTAHHARELNLPAAGTAARHDLNRLLDRCLGAGSSGGHGNSDRQREAEYLCVHIWHESF